MKKYIVLILAVAVIFVDSNDVTSCIPYLNGYVDKIFKSATDGYRDDMLLSPADWCTNYHANGIDAIKKKNDNTQQYYKYILETYKPILFKKRIPNPVEYCIDQLAQGLPSDYAGSYVDQTNSNEDMNVQEQGQKEIAGKGTSQIFNVVFDNEGQEIDLNKPYNNAAGIDKDNDKD